MNTVLVTGFEPFGGDKRNPSAEIAVALDGRTISGRRVVGAVLPCTFDRSAKAMRKLLKTCAPELVLCLGLAGGRTEITPERVAINVDDARIPDNAGREPVDVPVVRGGPAAYWSTLPVKAIVAALKRRRIPASVSQTAGTFVCNHVFYVLMHELRRRPRVRAGFIHVPWPAGWDRRRRGGIRFAAELQAIECAIDVSVRRNTDLRQAGGNEQ